MGPPREPSASGSRGERRNRKAIEYSRWRLYETCDACSDEKSGGLHFAVRQSIGLWDKDMSRALRDPLDKLYLENTPFPGFCKERGSSNGH